MIDVMDAEVYAFVGVLFSNKVIYNIVERDGEFKSTGNSIISFLNNDRNLFVSKIIESQSYDSIKLLLDDYVFFGNFYNNKNSNIETFNDIHSLMREDNIYNHYYIYDIIKDLLIIKIPEINDVIALDYKNMSDVNNFINNIKHGDLNGKI